MGMEPIQPKPSDLRVIGLLGSGQFASVWRVGSGNATTEYALKRCCKRIAAREHKGIENLLEEKRVHDMLHHAMIVRLLTSFQDEETCSFLLELCEGGDLGMLLDESTKQPEAAARFYGGCVVLALRHLHSKAWIQRDLKPANVLLDARGYAKLADFGFSARLERADSRTFSMCGTAEYAPPEMLRNQGRSFPSDWWAFGVLMYHLVTGKTPFDADDEDEIFDAIIQYAHGDPCKREAAQNMLSDHLRGQKVSEEGCDVIVKLLNPSEKKRLGSAQSHEGAPLEEQPWFVCASGWDWSALLSRQVAPPSRPWDTAIARNCFGEYRTAPITAERACQKWCEVNESAAPVEKRDQQRFRSFGPTVVLRDPDSDVWRARNPASPIGSIGSPEGARPPLR